METTTAPTKTFSIRDFFLYRFIRWLLYSITYLLIYTIYVVTALIALGVGFFLAAAEVILLFVYRSNVYEWVNKVIAFFGGSPYAKTAVWGGMIALIPFSIVVIYHLPLLPHSIILEGFQEFTSNILVQRDKPAREREAKKKLEEEIKWQSWYEQTSRKYQGTSGKENEGRKGEKTAEIPSSNTFNEIQSAMLLFRLHEGFTMDELKKAKREVIKMYHSDNTMNAQDDDKIKEINVKFDVLKGIAK